MAGRRPTRPQRRSSRKDKATRRRRGVSPWTWALAGSLVLALAAVGAVLLWSPGPVSSPPATTGFLAPSPAQAPPPFEEPRPPGRRERLRRLDEAVFSGLEAAGVPSADVHLGLAPGPWGEVSEVRVRLASRDQARRVARQLERALARAGAAGAWRDDGRSLSRELMLDQHPSHRLVLLYPSPQGPPPTLAPPPRPPHPRPRMALVVDDLGYSLKAAKRLLALPLDITFSILPYSPQGRRIAALARKKGHQVLVHLPMEPRAYPKLSPGPGALLTSMSPEQLRRQAAADLAQVPGAVGANNHMGSRFTEDPRALKPVLGVLKKRGLFFLDSLTSSRSRALALARSLGLPSSRRDLFLDHDPSPRAVRRQLERALALARRRGRVIAIAHPHPGTLQVLERWARRLRKQVEVVPVSRLLSPPAGPAGERALTARGGGPSLKQDRARQAHQ